MTKVRPADKQSATLTERRIRDAKPGEKTRIMWDGEVKGFGVRITKTGSKAYILNYRIDGRERRATLARCADIGLRDARERAGRELAAIRNGEGDPLSRREQASAEPTVAELVDRFFREYAPARIERGRMTQRTVTEYGKQARAYIVPAIGRERVSSVRRDQIDRMVRKLPPSQRNRTLAFTSRLFTLSEHWDMRPQHTNPCRGVERAREEPRDRILSTAELAALNGALRGLIETSPVVVAAITVAAVTGLRISEVLSMRWDHVDRETGRVLLPDTKSGRRTHDLPAAAFAVIERLPRINGWVFSMGRDAHVTYRTARAVFAKAVKAAGLTDVRLHDLRRSFMTAAASSGVGTHVLRDLLGHKTTAMADRYIRHVGNPVREAREQVGAAMAAAMEGKLPTGD